ncbi:MAG: alpha/beta hydrolase [Spirochaetota bacterium]
MHVYQSGKGETTLVFMAGHGTSCPTIDFKPLWMKLLPDYRIAVAERAGYGWSESSRCPRDLDTVLEQTRQALELAGERGPYILVPHSMAGLEAIYWAHRYPHEVKAIIGLDPLVPDFVEHSLEMPHKINMYAMAFVSRMGFSRLMPKTQLVKTFPLLNSRHLSEEDKKQFLAMFYKSTYTKDMVREIDFLKDNAKQVQTKKAPSSIPMYFFISDGTEVPGDDWRTYLVDYIQQCTPGNYTCLDCGHYVHHARADTIAAEMKMFIANMVS